ncbi:hypothetical protein L1787_16540 [Acuticoccus sp. M5D2P5]|uniref:hypothetical protein n=1 Tax=Acuticoccus kalidii TaxID=2910977 RepID=UPI001F28AE23|nr:hypothetical protein [Acuticoccus kalidii]MCF3935014.1 hypothetical protein [Acuticoccus kalidii]
MAKLPRQTYVVLSGRPYLGGAAREAGELVDLTEIEAEFPLMAGSIEPADGAEGSTNVGGGSGDEPDGLDDMTKEELLAEAETLGVEVKRTDTKAEIIKAIRG